MEEDRLSYWIEKLRKEDMPIFGHTAEEIARLASDESAPTSDLTNVILQDAAMTAQVLKLANSAYYASGYQLSTISRAVLVLGFETIRNICLSVSLIENLLKGSPRDQLLKDMARSFYAATLAHTLAVRRGDDAPEEVFIAALLYRLGEMAFWCFAGSEGEELLKALEGTEEEESDKVQRHVIGFALADLTKSLSTSWHLSDLLTSSFRERSDPYSRSRSIVFGHRFADLIERGLEDKKVRTLLTEIADYAGSSTETVEHIIQENAKRAIEVAKDYGAKLVVRRIAAFDLNRRPDEEVRPKTEELREPAAPQEPKPESFYLPDQALQLRILRELTVLTASRPDINSIVQLVLEGIFRGAGMDRSIFFLLTPDRQMLRPKFGLGSDASRILQTFQIPVGEGSKNCFARALLSQQSSWVTQITKRDTKELSADVQWVIQSGPFLIMPSIVHGRTIGAFYADRLTSKRELDNESFESFEHFVIQANRGLEYVTKHQA